MMRPQKWRGVNLGGWLVLERWMTPSLFEGLSAEDETGFCRELGPEQAKKRLIRHWDSFIGLADFEWLASLGINVVRIPVGHWLMDEDYPYHPSYGSYRTPYVQGGADRLDLAFEWAKANDLWVILDFHAAPGCQNGFDNGGIKDVCEWHTQVEYLEYSLTFLENLAKRYGSQPQLLGIEVLNEPRWDIATDYLKSYTEQACQRIRAHCDGSKVSVIFHDGFRDADEYSGFLTADSSFNVVLDIHRYQCFVQEDIEKDIYTHLSKTVGDWKSEADSLIRESNRQTVVGEWSLGIHPKMLELWQMQPMDTPSLVMDAFQQSVAYRAYAASQLAVFEKYTGWIFWSYKTETMPQWSFTDCVQNGWLPDRFVS